MVPTGSPLDEVLDIGAQSAPRARGAPYVGIPMLVTIVLILALIALVIGAFNLNTSTRVNWCCLGFLLFVLAWLLQRLGLGGP